MRKQGENVASIPKPPHHPPARPGGLYEKAIPRLAPGGFHGANAFAISMARMMPTPMRDSPAMRPLETGTV